jgi:hypothetical protein
MQSFVQMKKGGSFMAPRRGDIRQLTQRYPELLTEIEQLKRTYPAFQSVLDGNWSATEQLPARAWKFLETLLREYIPSVYLNIQERTLDELQALTAVLNARNESGEKRVLCLPDLRILSESVCERSAIGWRHWNGEMDVQRPRMGRQNRADGLALAYLQALHQAAFWQRIPIYFASRSPSMLQVMENHAGEFEPFRSADGGEERTIRSSWRQWDYFAELGYYTKGFHSALQDQGYGQDIQQDLVKRIKNINQRIASLRAARGDESVKQDRADTFSDWEVLRGSFDLEGLGDRQTHWNRMRVDPGAAQLVDLVRSVLSAQDSGMFIERRSALARNILAQIGNILGSLPRDARSWARPRSYQEESVTPLTDMVQKHIDIGEVLLQGLRAGQNGVSAPVMSHATTLLASITNSSDQEQRVNAANRLLALLTDEGQDEGIDPDLREWLIGVAFFFGRFLGESRTYLLPWLEAQPNAAMKRLELVTRAMCADTCRPTRDYDLGMRLLLAFQSAEEESTLNVDTVIWHCLKGNMLLEWMERAGENFEIYPQPGGRGGDTAILVPMLTAVAEFIRGETNALQVQAADIALRLAGRYIPEDVLALTREAFDRKLSWLRTFRTELREIETWFQGARPHSPHAWHTLGYYTMKVALIGDVDTAEEQLERALGYLKEAKHLAEMAGDKRTEEMVIEHVEWASARIGAFQ